MLEKGELILENYERTGSRQIDLVTLIVSHTQIKQYEQYLGVCVKCMG